MQGRKHGLGAATTITTKHKDQHIITHFHSIVLGKKNQSRKINTTTPQGV